MSQPSEDLREELGIEGLQLRNEVDWAYWLNYAYITIFNIMRKENIMPEEALQAVEFLDSVIPETYKKMDKIYYEELELLKEDEIIDLRPSFAGMKIDVKTCLEMGVKISETRRIIKPYKKLQAITNLLNRLNVLTKKDYIEKFTGLKFKETGKIEETVEESDEP